MRCYRMTEIRSAAANLRYAQTTVALLETPMTQCTRTLPPWSKADCMKRHALGRWMRRSSYSESCTGMIRWIVPSGKASGSGQTDRTWVMPNSGRRSRDWAAVKLEEFNWNQKITGYLDDVISHLPKYRPSMMESMLADLLMVIFKQRARDGRPEPEALTGSKWWGTPK
jgi:hypothetical protein